jgi:hypothetical protein
MSVRNLIIIVLSLVTGTALTVGWYLEGENEVRAEMRASETPIRHVPRTLQLDDARPTARWSKTSTRPSSASARPTRTAAPSTWWIGSSSSETSTSFEPRR